MAYAAARSILGQIESVFDGSSVAGMTDGQLLERFTAGRDAAGDAAFAALVTRYGPMVLHVCRQFLSDRHHAEDAFQAVFLVLARKACSIREPELLGTWLYGVAIRTARKAKVRLDRRRRNEDSDIMKHQGWGSGIAVELTVEPAEDAALAREQAEALHEEIDRLPQAFRTAVVLYYFEGLTLDDAASRLRWPAGTFRSRLARAREKLRRGLARRGLVLPATALSAALVPRSASASVSTMLCDFTTRVAITFAAHHAAGAARSTPAAALAQEVLRTMLLYKLKSTALILLLIAALASGAGYLTRSLATAKDVPRQAPAPRVTEKSDVLRPSPGRMTVVGRVLDPDGKPVQGAVVDLITRFRTLSVGTDDETKPWLTVLGQGRSDGAGRFRLDAPRTASSRVFSVYALAAAPRYGLGWAELNPDDDQPAAEIKLLPEHTFRVRLVDVSGAPARNVEVQVLSIGRRMDGGRFEGISISGTPPDGIRAWPRPITTNDQGRIALTGIGCGPGVKITLSVRDARYATQQLEVDASEPSAVKEATLALEPARTIAGRVLDADTGRPIPDAVVAVAAGRGKYGGMRVSRFRADDHGRFTANPAPGDYFRVSAFAPEGQPYLVPQVEFAWTKPAVKEVVDISVPRGVLIRGKVIEAGTSRPLAASTIYFIPVGERLGVLSGSQTTVASRGDGSFQIVVPPGKGHLLVFGPTGDYILSEIGRNVLESGRTGGWRYRVHAIIPYEVKAGEPPREVTATLRPGVTIKGRVEGPDGQKITDASVITTLHVEANHPSWLGRYQVKVQDGRFELHGLAPEGSTRIHVLDAGHEWGATVDIAGRQAGEVLIIRLQPCGRARIRFVGPDGKPITKHEAIFEFVATPGASVYTRRSKQEQAALAADADFLANVDRKHYWNDPVADAEGRFTMVSLIPGAIYRISDFSTVNSEVGAQVRKEFTVKPGETVDLGDIRIEKPRG
jgi:RNA polymerase sigma factor (sigma-70 family)